MGWFEGVGFGGPVGFFFASLGFSGAVLVARAWEYVAQEAHCIPTCPSFRAELLGLHHFYYGLGLVLVSVGVLVLARRQRVRWDASLILGVGLGLLADEAGLLLLGVPYGSPVSFLVLGIFGGGLFLGTVNTALRDGTGEFWVLDRADVLTVLSILLAMAGVLYLDRPLRTMVEFVGGLSWVSALVLLLLYGRRHFHRTWAGPG